MALARPAAQAQFVFVAIAMGVFGITGVAAGEIVSYPYWCIEKGYALLGYSAGADFARCKTRDDIVDVLKRAGQDHESTDFAVTAANAFVLQVKPGDLVVVSEGNLKFRAIGEVTGHYCRLVRDDGDHYVQCRDVRWLRVYSTALPFEQLMDVRFSQAHIYELRDGSINRSKLQALLPLLPAPPALDADAIVQFLENEFLSGEGTVFAGISRVPPGHALTIDYGLNMQRERFWSLQSLVTQRLDMMQAQEAFSALFEQVMREHMRADVPFGLFLSGGIDSAAIATLMSRLNERPVTAFTCGFDAPGARDERAAAESVAYYNDLKEKLKVKIMVPEPKP